MSPCKRGCCWTAYQVCSRSRGCDCHWGDWLNTPKNTGRTITYRDPTGNEAANNADRRKRK